MLKSKRAPQHTEAVSWWCSAKEGKDSCRNRSIMIAFSWLYYVHRKRKKRRERQNAERRIVELAAEGKQQREELTTIGTKYEKTKDKVDTIDKQTQEARAKLVKCGMGAADIEKLLGAVSAPKVAKC